MRGIRTSDAPSRRIGAFCLLVFVTGVLLLPFAHNLRHRDDHVHGPGQSHRHPPHDAPDPAHGQGSIEHCSVAFTSAPAFVLPEIWLPLPETTAGGPKLAPVDPRLPSALQPRAPPLSLLLI